LCCDDWWVLLWLVLALQDGQEDLHTIQPPTT
jgi:hypothetical protein